MRGCVNSWNACVIGVICVWAIPNRWVVQSLHLQLAVSWGHLHLPPLVPNVLLKDLVVHGVAPSLVAAGMEMEMEQGMEKEMRREMRSGVCGCCC